MKKRLGRLIAFTALFLCGYYAALLTVALAVSPVQSDLAVVLGNEVLPDGTPSDRLKARVDCAIALYKKGLVKRIMVSGGTGISGHDEATAMKNYLLSRHIPLESVIVDSVGFNTMATAVNTAMLMKQQGIGSVVIVTQYFHIPRTMLAFTMAGIPNYSADYPPYAEWRDIPSTLREMVAIPVYWLKY